MELIRLAEPGSWSRIRKAQKRLSVLEGAVPQQSSQKTTAVFGAPLTPVQTVRRILEDVRRDGDKALFRYARALDLFDLGPNNLRVTLQEMTAAREAISKDFLEAVGAAIERVRAYQQHIKIGRAHV